MKKTTINKLIDEVYAIGMAHGVEWHKKNIAGLQYEINEKDFDKIKEIKLQIQNNSSEKINQIKEIIK